MPSLLLLLGLVLPFFGPAAARPAPAPNPYVGMWEYRTDSTLFRVQLREKRNFQMPNQKVSDVVLGSYSFSRNGRVVEETFSEKSRYVAPFGMLKPGYETRLSVVFQDQLGLNHARVSLQFKPGQPDVLVWTREYALETVRINDNRPARFTLPNTFELVRTK
ncbi:hypothetical protein F0P96_02105 [Hymenobacter busanensis]|uniref:DUF6705 domain-containing protein n=1 Tax=Hymenobacter busanensis TaxID=2607656 RepID=A0A7L4ZVE6_9BACT|nr:DUF6705 family protein [Hymenobacter busanensis]KAA9339436.1 hypothetical protein F0P96_02105 [Hymenobacter busanensis]QHJ06806.1 hypothetical protein GUY19_05645 [Hymenobacter busanensis]